MSNSRAPTWGRCLQDGGEAGGSGSGFNLDDLEDLGVIGSGSSGVAKKVRNKRTGALLVLKVIQFDVGSDVVRKQVCGCAGVLWVQHATWYGVVLGYGLVLSWAAKVG